MLPHNHNLDPSDEVLTVWQALNVLLWHPLGQLVATSLVWIVVLAYAAGAVKSELAGVQQSITLLQTQILQLVERVDRLTAAQPDK